MREGRYLDKKSLPFILGADAAGVVEAIGGDVTLFKVIFCILLLFVKFLDSLAIVSSARRHMKAPTLST